MLPVRKEDHLTLEAVHDLFDHWRKEKKHRDPIPPALREAALSLADRYPVYAIAKRLRLNYTDFKARAAARVCRGTPSFVEIAPFGVTIEMTKPTGERLRITGACNVAELARIFLE